MSSSASPSGSMTMRQIHHATQVAKKIKMGRKKSDKSNRNEEPDEKDLEAYQPTGNFQTDFNQLCNELNMYRPPPVYLRPKRPPSPVQNEQQVQAPTGRRTKEDKKMSVVQPTIEPEEETPEEKAVIEQFGFKPKTFTVKHYLDLMKPCVHVDMENPDRPDSVTEVHAKNWRLELPMLHCLGRCFEKLNRLSTIVFWRVAADASVIAEMAEMLHHLDSVRSLSLESNCLVPSENYYELIRVESNLTKLQLRFNRITDAGVAKIADQLSGLRDSPSKLVSLDLSSNCVQDDGATALAQALRSNRILIHLSLSNNRLTDRGAAALAVSCSRFFLTHEEIVERRKLLSGTDRHAGGGASPPPSRRGASDRPGSVRSSQEKSDKGRSAAAASAAAGAAGAGKTGAKGKKEDKLKSEEKTKGKMQKEDSVSKIKGKAPAPDRDSKGSSSSALKSGKGKGSRVKVSTPMLDLEQQDSGAHFDSDHPLLERADTAFAPGYLLVPGNHVLALLNLSRNQITDTGVHEWKTAVRYQAAYMSKQKVNGTGLLRLMLQGNPFSTETESYKILQHTMATRDPFSAPAPVAD